MNRQWKKYDQLMEKCYLGMADGGADINDWNDCFDVLIQIIENERESNPDFGRELNLLDDETDYRHDVQGWLEDYLDELDMREMYLRLETVCRKLLKIFEWREEYPSDIRFMLASALGNQGRVEEARRYCEDWEVQEKDNPLASAALIYSMLRMKDYEGAEEIVRQHITENTVCSEENDVIFTAALQLYKANGNKKMEKKMDAALEEYDKALERYFMGLDDEGLEFGDIDWEMDEDDLPFN